MSCCDNFSINYKIRPAGGIVSQSSPNVFDLGSIQEAGHHILVGIVSKYPLNFADLLRLCELHEYNVQ